VVVENGNQLRNLSFSRELEQEADDYAAEILEENKISVNGMVELFEILKVESKGLEINELLSTHPDIDARINEAEKHVKFNQQTLTSNPNLVQIFNQLKNKN